MTNILFFSTINRDDESASSSTRSETSEPPQTEAEVSLSAYSVIGKAWLACAGPQLEADEDVDNSTANTSAPASNTNGNESFMKKSKLKSISYMELQAATKYFDDSNIVGSGEFGSVFKGWINENTLTATASGEGIAVAVKILTRGRAKRMSKWLKQVNYEGRFHHPNLVRTLAYCTEGEEPMVVYEFMPQGSLADHLFRRGSDSEPLSWSLRLKIALGAAKCLNFLHRNKAVHGNIRSSNILLDSYYNSKLSFGVARESPAYIESISGLKTSRLDSVNEYTAPECIRQGYLTATGDVYSFGVVLLEILFGPNVIKSELNLATLRNGADLLEILFGRKVTKSELNLAMLRNGADLHVKGNNIADQLVPSLDRSFRGDERAMRDAKAVIALAMICIFQEPDDRMAMDFVVHNLDKVYK